MKHADLKRLAVGTKLRLVESLMGPTPPEKQERTVARVQSNGIWFATPTGRSWLSFGKASEFRETPGGFALYEGEEVAARYVFAREWAAGDRVTYSGYPGVVERPYGSGMFEVRLASGLTCVSGTDLVSA